MIKSQQLLAVIVCVCVCVYGHMTSLPFYTYSTPNQAAAAGYTLLLPHGHALLIRTHLSNPKGV